MCKKVRPVIEFNITQKCNFNCEYCSQGFLNRNEPEKLINASDEVLNGFIDFVKSVGSEFEINLIGGEPFCHPKFIETTAKIAELDNKMILFSNMSFPISTFKKFFDAASDKLKLIHGTLHIKQVSDLDKSIENIIKIKELMHPDTKMEIVSIVTEEDFNAIKYVEQKLTEAGIDFIYIRLIKPNGEISTYSKEIEDYIKPIEGKYQTDMLNARKIDTSKILCYAGSKIFHVNTHGFINRCWSYQHKKELQCFGNVCDKESIKILTKPMPCYSPICYCQHPTARNAYFYSCKTPFYRFDLECKTQLKTLKHRLAKTSLIIKNLFN